MNVLKLFLWYTWKTFINAIKRAWKVFLTIAIVFVVVFAAIVVIDALIPEDDGEETEDTEIVEADDREINTEFDFVDTDEGLIMYENGQAHNVSSLLVSAIIGMVVMLFLTLSIASGVKNGVNIFTMQDVNFLFPSPNSPQSILMFKMLGQLGVVLLASLYLLGQVPNLIMNMGMTVPGVLLLFAAYIILQLMCKMLSVFMYVSMQNHGRIKEFLNKYAMYFTVLPALFVVIIHFACGTGWYESASAVFTSIPAKLIPVWGWMMACGSYAAESQYGLCLVYMALSIAATIIIGYVAWKIPADFYEDAFETASATFIQTENAQTMAAGGMNSGVKHDGKRAEKKWEKRRNSEIVFEGFDGAKVFFAKTMLNRKRMHPLGGLWSPTAQTYFWAVLGETLVLKFLLDVGSSQAFVTVAAATVIALMFFRSFLNPLQVDLGVNFIYMIPEKPSVTLFWGMLGQVADGALDLLPMLLPLMVFTLNPVLCICIYLVLVSMHLFFGTTALFVNLVMSNYLPAMFSMSLQTIIRLVPFVPVIVIYFTAMTSDFYILPLLLIVIINLMVSGLTYWLCPYHLHKGRK